MDLPPPVYEFFLQCQSMAPTAFCTFQVYGQQARLNGALDEAVEVLHAATALNPTYDTNSRSRV